MPAGRPPIFKDADEMQEKIREYFNGGMKKRQVTVGRGKDAQTIEVEVPTITGLCLHLGFDSRQSFYDYEQKPEFAYTVKRARLLIETEYEQQLQAGNTIGAIFALKNFGWKDTKEIEKTVKTLNFKDAQ